MLQRSLLAVTICELMTTTKQSITGVTYRDKFDFEERYAKPHECDPIYWHPLHLPPHCAAKFEMMIRNRLWDMDEKMLTGQMEKMLNEYQKIREPKESKPPDDDDSCEDDDADSSMTSGPANSDLFGQYPVQEQLVPYDFPFAPLAPYEKMIQMLTRDVMRRPAQPVVDMVPYIGISAIYKQPVSQNTVDVIKDIGSRYAAVANQAGVVWCPGNPEECNKPVTYNGKPKFNDTEVEKKIAVIESIIDKITRDINETGAIETNENGVIKKKYKMDDSEIIFEWIRPKSTPPPRTLP